MVSPIKRQLVGRLVGVTFAFFVPQAAACLTSEETTDARIAQLIGQLKDERTAHIAFRSLKDIGPEVVPQLVRAYRREDGELRIPTWMLLLEIGSKAAPPLVNALKSDDPLTREDAAVGLELLATHGHKPGFNLADTPNENVIPALIEALSDQKVGVRKHAIEAIRAIGPDALGALPALIDVLKDEKSVLTDQAISAIGQLGSAATPAVERLLEHSSEIVRTRAAVALRKIRVAELIEQLKDKGTWPHSVPALVELGADAVEPILRVQEREWMPFEGGSPGPSLSPAVNRILWAIGKDAVPPLVAALHDDNALLRKLAAGQLGGLGQYAKEAEAAIRKAAEEGVEEDALPGFVRGIDLETILNLKVALKDQAAPALLKALKDEDGQVRTSAMIALGSIGAPAREALPALLEMLTDKDNLEGGPYASRAIAKIRGDAVPQLTEALAHGDALVRRRASQALAQIGPDAKEAVPALIQALEDEDDTVRRNAARALGNLGRDAELAVRPLIEVCRDGDSFTRKTTIEAFGKIGPAAKEAVPLIILELTAADNATRTVAAEALAGIGPEAGDAVPALADTLKDESARVRVRASIALAKIGPGAKPAVPALIHALSDNLDWLSPREYAARALGEIGPDAAEAVPALIQVLTESDTAIEAMHGSTRERRRGYHGQMRAAAAEALGKIGPGAKGAVPALREALDDENERVRQAAAEALQKTVPDGGPQ